MRKTTTVKKVLSVKSTKTKYTATTTTTVAATASSKVQKRSENEFESVLVDEGEEVSEQVEGPAAATEDDETRRIAATAKTLVEVKSTTITDQSAWPTLQGPHNAQNAVVAIATARAIMPVRSAATDSAAHARR